MRPNRRQRSLTAWVLYFSILFGAFACAIGHGQMAGLQLSGLDGQFCSFEGNFAAGADLSGTGIIPPSPLSGDNCVLSSTFAAIILAAFFGLIGLLTLSRTVPLPPLLPSDALRDRWPTANPRASPLPLPAH